VKWRLHSDAAVEHEEQVTYYEERRVGLGARYHSATMLAITSACQTPLRFRVVRPPDIRKVSLRGFPYSVIYREADSVVQVLAVAHHRREPGYWARRP
jgi:plasmid stabilization system protein ParE